MRDLGKTHRIFIIMKLHNTLTIILLAAGIACASAQTQSHKNNAHQKAHAELLANAKIGLDKSVIKDFIKYDIENREAEFEMINQPSAETSMMLTDLLTEARTHIGKRYRAGSKGPSSFDCSGFSSYVFRQFGIALGASSRDQYKQGVAVDRKSLRKGDLVFFTGRNSRSSVVGHVGIVVSANNETGDFTFIHASTSQGVKIDSSTGYYARRFVGAKRVIND